MTSQQSKITLEIENPHTVTYEGLNIHDVLSQTTDIEILQKLLDQGERPCSSGQCFILAARTHSLELVKKLLELEPAGINTEDEDGKSLLSYFAGQPKDLLQLLKMGANPAVSDIENVLERVIDSSNEEDSEVIESILKHYALDINIKKNLSVIYDTMRNLTIKYKNKGCPEMWTQILTYLSKSGVSLVDNEGVTLLKYCSDNFELVKILVKLGTPLQEPYIQYALKTLVSMFKTCANHESELDTSLHHNTHKNNVQVSSNISANVSDVYDILNSIVKKGHKLVDNEGISLVKYCRSEEMFLYLLRLGADPNIPEIKGLFLDLCARTCSDNVVKEILTLFSAAGVMFAGNSRCLLHKNIINTNLVCKLLNIITSPFIDGENFLKYLLIDGSCDYVKYLEFFIESGYNIIEKDQHGCTFLCSAILLCVENTNKSEKIDTSCELVRYLLDHPDICSDNFKLNCQPGYHPQDIIAGCHRLSESRIAEMILTSKFKDTRRVTRTGFSGICYPVDMSLISQYMMHCAYNCTNNLSYIDRSVEDIWRDIDFLCEHGFSLNDPEVSPLTVLTLHEDKMPLIKILLQRQCVINVEQRILVFLQKDRQDLKESLKIPDALTIAAIKDVPIEVVQWLEPHAAFPPLALLLFSTFNLFRRYNNKIELFRVLLSLGRVPHGTQAYRAIRKKVREMAKIQKLDADRLLPVELDIPLQVGGIKSQELTMFDVAHRSPLSLLELSRYAVKMCLADTAAASNTQSLPQLFKSLLPPGLTDQHIAHKIEQVRNCEDKWLSNEDELLKNPPSLMFVKSVLNIPDVEYDLDTGYFLDLL